MSSRLCRIKDWEQLAREAHFKPGEASALCCVSNRQFERYFKDQFSMSPRKWFRQLQCRLAKELMARGYSSKATAAELEFANSAHFCREFKKWCGEPPQFFSPTWTKRNGASPLDKHVAIKQSS